MAFVHRSKRATGMPLATTPSALGPGSYTGELVSPSGGGAGGAGGRGARARLSYAPFASSAERGMLEERYSAVDFTPGPGEYSANFPGHTQAPSISTSFVSSVPRFGRESDPSQQAPGPGAYQGVDLSWAKQGVKARARRRDGVPGAGGARRAGGVEWVRVSAPPSIPAPTQSFGYEENGAGELVLQRPSQLAGHAGVGFDTAGPGEYLSRTHEHPLSHERKRGFVEWSKSRTHREMNIKPTGLQQPGPGAYLSMDGSSAGWSGGGAGAGDSSVRGGGRNGPGRHQGKKVSAFFASKSKRLRDDGGVGLGASRDPVPGPGTYAARSDFDKRASTYVPEQFQFFGSKTGRSGAGSTYAHSASNPTPGPGAYQVKSSIRTGAPEGAAAAAAADAPHLSFSSTSARFRDPPGAGGGVASLPGPGAYVDQTNTSLELSKKIFGRNTSFGTTEARFHAATDSAALRPGAGNAASAAIGPGKYEANTSSIRSGKKPLSVFVSATRRFDAASGRRADAERAAAEAAQGGAASFAESVPRGIGTEPTWGNGARANPSAAFANPRQPRFDDRAESKARAAAASLGPGRYDPNPGANLYRSSPAVSSSFKTPLRDQAAGRDAVPGPGSYARDVTQSESSLIKRSFNITIAT